MAYTRTVPGPGTPVTTTLRRDQTDAGTQAATNQKALTGIGIERVVLLTQQAYDALNVVDQMTLYIIR